MRLLHILLLAYPAYSIASPAPPPTAAEYPLQEPSHHATSPGSQLEPPQDAPEVFESNSEYKAVFYAQQPAAFANGIRDGEGWLSRWLAMGGEGEVVVHLRDAENLTLPHRPAAFPTHVNRPLLPISGTLVPFSSFPSPRGQPNTPLACLPPLSPVDRPKPSYPLGEEPPKDEGRYIALIERGGCDFATKVRAAQDRGAIAVIVGDSVLRLSETDEEGRKREGLITMFSPEDTAGIHVPSVFVSRASYLDLRDMLWKHVDSGIGKGLWIDIGEGSDEGGTLTNLLSFALLMPTLFLLATIAVHRIRLARQREKDRAPALVVLSLPERIWAPDIVWEKEDESSDGSLTEECSPTPGVGCGKRRNLDRRESGMGEDIEEEDEGADGDEESEDPVAEHPPPPIHPSSIDTPPIPHTLNDPSHPPIPLPPHSSSPPESPSDHPGPSQHHHHKKTHKPKRQYFSKDECAICMDAFEKGDVVRILPCGHVFHKEECDEWLMKWRKLCPTCRADVTLPQGKIRGSTVTPVTAAGQPPASASNLTPSDLENGIGEDVALEGVYMRIGERVENGWTALAGWAGRTRRAMFGRGGERGREEERVRLVDDDHV
ncbi:hypothetical protein L202_00848 [Cryptococcus amylolentus CBS 6039]|uniref:RING-type E3 ubiquitin transferase n=1 Tax=Cryptococcus amylolentus CBS 6039 TaxID=1295533 RepID=A0A1E3I8W5_9TREE|nr:hypothetical protein L202_00848 [Cryptococcus amylolentus CBS 6039]ODN85017.1 hypothetical protein L202_00848 [Cryptococcus amylolentus CBS 6039]